METVKRSLAIFGALCAGLCLSLPAQATFYGKSGGGGGQDPAAVAITGGTIVGVNTATRTVQGAESAADKAFSDDWNAFDKRVYATMIADIPGLTGFKSFRLGQLLPGSAIGAQTNDGKTEGGGMTGPATSTFFGFGGSVFQNTPGGNWAIGFRAKFGNPGTAGEIGYAGLSDSGGSAVIVCGTRNSVSSTKWTLRVANGVSVTDGTNTGTADTNWHDAVITDDGTTIRFRIDGTLVSSITTRTNLHTSAMIPAVLNDAANNVLVADMAIGYVAP